MRIIFHVFCITVLFHSNVFGYTFQRERDLKNYEKLIHTAQEFGLKRIIKKDRNKPVFIAEFDSLGNLQKVVDYRYKRKHHETVHFTCKNGVISKYEVRHTFIRNSFWGYILSYDKYGKLTTFVETFFMKNNLYGTPDTLRLDYNANGQLKSKILRNGADTIQFFYSNDSLIGNSATPIYYQEGKMDQRIYNDHGCLIGFDEGGDTRSYQVRNEQCETLERHAEIKIDDQWVTLWKNFCRYEDDLLMEETFYYTRRFHRKDPSKSKTKFMEKRTFHYHSNGLIESVKIWNKKGKLTKVVRTEYEYY